MKKHSLITAVLVTALLFYACAVTAVAHLDSFLRLDSTVTRIDLRSAGVEVRITDEADIARIADDLNAAKLRRAEPLEPTVGRSYSLAFYNGDEEIASVSDLGSDWAACDGYHHTAEGDPVDTAFLDELLCLMQPLSELVYDHEESVERSLAGTDRDTVLRCWGEADGVDPQSGAETYLATFDGWLIAVHYDENDAVEHVRFRNEKIDRAATTFSYAEVLETYTADTTGVTVSGPIEPGIEPYKIFSPSEAANRTWIVGADSETHSFAVAYDASADMWEVVCTDTRRAEVMNVYLDSDGMIQLLVEFEEVQR